MSIFDYKGYKGQKAAELVITSQKLTRKTASSLVTGWREIEPSELHLPKSSKDIQGYYTIASPVTGNRPISGMGPQAKIWGELGANGEIKRLALVWRGTNDILDVADYFKISGNSFVPHMKPLLNSLKSYAQEIGLKSEDVLITGYSLGGAMTNIMAKHREHLADGFFKNSDYIGGASPVIYDNKNVILNIGFENDAVFRILNDAPTFVEALHQMKWGMVNADKDFTSTTDNMIAVNFTYASIFWKLNPLAKSILNYIGGWAAHSAYPAIGGLETFTKSKFYEYTHQDSRVLIDNLDRFSRLFLWVKDKSNDHKGAFFIGNDGNNLLQSGKTGDYIDARGGNDKIYLDEGADRVDGGTGVDTVILSGTSTDWNAFRLKDGTLFMAAKRGGDLKQLESVEKITFNDESFNHIRPYDVTNSGLHSNRYLLKFRNQDVKYEQYHKEGTNGDDTITGLVVFGKAGNDKLEAFGKHGSLLHGGEGNDILIGHQGNDKLYGGEGHDMLYAGAGNDLVYGGLGNDVFMFDKQSTGTTVIKDFNQYYGEQDTLLFSKELFSTVEAFKSATKQIGDDLHIKTYNTHVIVEHSHLDDVVGNVGIV